MRICGGIKVVFDNREQLVDAARTMVVSCFYVSDCDGYGDLVDEKYRILMKRTDRNDVFEYIITPYGRSMCKYDI